MSPERTACKIDKRVCRSWVSPSAESSPSADSACAALDGPAYRPSSVSIAVSGSFVGPKVDAPILSALAHWSRNALAVRAKP